MWRGGTPKLSIPIPVGFNNTAYCPTGVEDCVAILEFRQTERWETSEPPIRAEGQVLESVIYLCGARVPQ